MAFGLSEDWIVTFWRPEICHLVSFLSCFLSSGVSSVFVHNYSDCVLGTEHCQNMGGLHSMPKCILYVETEDWCSCSFRYPHHKECTHPEGVCLSYKEHPFCKYLRLFQTQLISDRSPTSDTDTDPSAWGHLGLSVREDLAFCSPRVGSELRLVIKPWYTCLQCRTWRGNPRPPPTHKVFAELAHDFRLFFIFTFTD